MFAVGTVLARVARGAQLSSRALSNPFSSSPTTSESLKFCVVGSGPAGFYTVDKILKRFGESAQVDIIEALPTPFGLVRSGVAPDHQDTKNVINQFTQTARHPQVSLFGNVTVGSRNSSTPSSSTPSTATAAVSLAELRALYHAVVLAYGAESDRTLNIPGEDLFGVLPAREFVRWYNGHPSSSFLVSQYISHHPIHSVAVCGLGNVAIDIARVLLQSIHRLCASDAAQHAVDALRDAPITSVHLIGRRGPAQAAFTPKELRELLSMEGIKVEIHPPGCLSALRDDEVTVKELEASRIKRRVVDVLSKAEKVGAEGEEGVEKPRTLHLHFLRSPVEILGDENNCVQGIRMEVTELRSSGGNGSSSGQKAVGTGVYEELSVQMVLESIGYKSLPMEGAPFDASAGVIPNRLGHVESDCDSDPLDEEGGLFVCGWLKRGPSGIIGTNLVDAEQTVDTMVKWFDSKRQKESDGRGGGDYKETKKKEKEGREGLMRLLEQREVQVVDVRGWEAIDAEEVKRGEATGKPREKIISVQEMLDIATSSANV